MIWGHDASGCIAPLDSFAVQLGGAPLDRNTYDPCLKVTMTSSLWSTPADAAPLDLVFEDETGEATMTIDHLAPPVTLQADRTRLAAGEIVELTLAGPPVEQFHFGVITALRVDDGSPLDLEVR